MIRLNKITKTYKHGLFNEVVAVRNIDLNIGKGVSFGIAGNSGCGKSTIARMITGLEKSTSGRIEIAGRNIEKLSRRDISQYVQIIFQHPESSFDPKIKFGNSLTEALKISKGFSLSKGMKKINELMDLVGLHTDLLERYPHEVSGGEAQRLSIVRALSLEAEVLILDEATSMLDLSVQARIFEIIMEIKNRFNITLIIISHDLELLSKVCDELAIMKDGEIIEKGDTENIMENPEMEYTKKLIENFEFFI